LRPGSRLRSLVTCIGLLLAATQASAQTPPTDADTAATTPPAPTPPPAAVGERAVEVSPMPPIEKNPVDILPTDVVYPPNVDIKPKPVVWRREWPRFSTADWIITGAGAAVALASAIVPPVNKHTAGPWLFDEDVRDAIRLRDPQARFNARDVSDVILSLEATWPFFVDALITVWWFRGSPDAAAQMALVDGEALAIVTAIQGATNTIASRERPYGQNCGTGEQPQQTNECEGNVRHHSFFSGHSAFTFMSAGLICTHHIQHGLLRGAGDSIACVVAYAGAAATATLRVMGDMHYATDVLTGAAVGTAVGLAVPLLHYRNVNVANETIRGERKHKPYGVDVSVIPVGAGLGLGGTF